MNILALCQIPSKPHFLVAIPVSPLAQFCKRNAASRKYLNTKADCWICLLRLLTKNNLTKNIFYCIFNTCFARTPRIVVGHWIPFSILDGHRLFIILHVRDFGSSNSWGLGHRSHLRPVALPMQGHWPTAEQNWCSEP